MERINPTNGVRIGLLLSRARVLRATAAIDPGTGGIVEGEPEVVYTMMAGVEPSPLTRAQERITAGQVTNIADFVVTAWWRPELKVAQWIDFWDRSIGWRRLEILAIRDQGQQHRYQEILCKELVTPIVPLMRTRR